MDDKTISKAFDILFPLFAPRVTHWNKLSENEVHVVIDDQLIFVFTYYGPNDWMFETIASYQRRTESHA